MDLKDTYNLIAEDWVKDHSSDTWWIEGTNKFVSLVKPGSLVLDVGCGAGVKSKYLLAHGLKVVGVDFSEKMIEIARREVLSGEFYVADIKHLEVLPELFDGILAQAVLLHIPKVEIPMVLEGLKDRLKQDGILYIAVKEQWPDAKEEEMLVEEDYGYKYERFFSYFTLPEIKANLTGIGMKICYENIAQSGKTNWIQIIAQKV